MSDRMGCWNGPHIMGNGKAVSSQWVSIFFGMILFDFQVVHISFEHVWVMFCFHLTADDEWRLIEIIKKFARRGFPFTKSKVMLLVYQYAEINGRKSFSKFTKQAGGG